MAELSKPEDERVAARPSRRYVRHYSAFAGMLLGGIPLFFGGPVEAAIVLGILGVGLCLTRLTGPARVWLEEPLAWWVRLLALIALGMGTLGWTHVLVGGPIRYEMMIYVVGVPLGLLYKRSHKSSPKRERRRASGDR